MKLKHHMLGRAIALFAILIILIVFSVRPLADAGTCGGQMITLPFNDVSPSSVFFCSIASAFFTGLTNGTTATTYSPGDVVNREQMAAFITRTLDQSLKRGSRRAALNQWWTTTPHYDIDLGTTGVGPSPFQVQSDGTDLWVSNVLGNSIVRVGASDGRLLDAWFGAASPRCLLIAMGRVFVTGSTSPGSLYMINPTQDSGIVSTLSNNLGHFSLGIAFDGDKIWTANSGTELDGGSVSIITPGTTMPWGVTTVTTGFSRPYGILFDGANIWVTDSAAGTILKLDSNGNILQTVDVGVGPLFPVFDGTNIWIPTLGGGSPGPAVVVVRASTGMILARLTGNGLSSPNSAAFDGERILVTNGAGGDSVSVWKATDLTPIGSFSTGTGSEPSGACSDGVSFWFTLLGAGKIARF